MLPRLWINQKAVSPPPTPTTSRENLYNNTHFIIITLKFLIYSSSKIVKSIMPSTLMGGAGLSAECHESVIRESHGSLLTSWWHQWHGMASNGWIMTQSSVQVLWGHLGSLSLIAAWPGHSDNYPSLRVNIGSLQHMTGCTLPLSVTGEYYVPRGFCETDNLIWLQN